MIIDKTYCINLERRPDRWTKSEQQFSREELTVERFAAVDGNDFKKEYPSSRGNCGCTLSHYFLIERAKLLGFDNVMIFEDDADLTNQFKQRLQECIADLPEDWDMLLFAGIHKKPLIKITDRIYQVQETYTTGGYLLRSTMFDLVIDQFKSLQVPVDCFFVDMQLQRKIFVTDPPIAWQRKSFSDIQNRVMHYPWMQTNHDQ